MRKWILSLALALSVTLPDTSSQAMIDGDYHPTNKFSPEEHSYLNPDAVADRYLAVKGMKITGFSKEGLIKLEEAFTLLEEVVNSEEFKDRVINFKNAKGERAFASNNGLTNEEIYEIFMEGRETLQMDTPGEMNFYLQLYNRPWSKVIGYTTPTTNVININWKFFRNFEPYEVASNLAHEWTHKIGFGHKSAKEHDSAPYAIGYIITDLSKKMYQMKKLH